MNHGEDKIGDKDISEFELKLNKMNVSGAVFDMIKLLDISKNIISKYTASQIYQETLNWAEKYDKDFMKILLNNKNYAIKVLNIERENIKPRKDISAWSEVKNIILYMFDKEFEKNESKYEFQKINEKKDIEKILKEYLNNYFDISDNKEKWFQKIKELSEKLGYAKETKEFKQNPEKYKAHVGDVCTVIRVALTKRANTPDLYEIIQVLGKESVIKRIEKLIKN